MQPYDVASVFIASAVWFAFTIAILAGQPAVRSDGAYAAGRSDKNPHHPVLVRVSYTGPIAPMARRP